MDLAGNSAPRTVAAVAELEHVLWIGGASGLGKTTIARRLARRHGLRWYNADTRTWEHRDRALHERNPAALRWEAMTPYERWVTTPPSEMVELSLNLQRWPMIADDVRRLPASPLIVAEGSTVLPELVATGIADRSRAVWLAASPELQRTRLEAREGAPPGDPDAKRARENVLQLWLLVAAEIERRVREFDVTVLVVDGPETADEVLAAVEVLFAEALAAGPRAATASERRALIRFANEAIVGQVFRYLARPWAAGDADSMVRAFACECDDAGCQELVELPVAAFPSTGEPVISVRCRRPPMRAP
jgi:shikimate kinase